MPQERLIALVDHPKPTVLKLGQFIGNPDDANFHHLCDWLELGESDRDTLLAILKEAVRERMAWEKTNAVVDNPATGRWTVVFPSDHGQARAELRKKLEESFPPKTAAAIDLAGNLGSFFNTGPDNFQRTHGEVRIAVKFNDVPRPRMERRLGMLFHDEESSLGLPSSSARSAIIRMRRACFPY